MSDDRKLILTNGRAPKNKSGDLVSRKDVETFVESFANNVLLPKVDEMMQHYLRQSPELVARMIADAMQANGLTLLPPGWTKITPPAADPPSAANEPSTSEGEE